MPATAPLSISRPRTVSFESYTPIFEDEDLGPSTKDSSYQDEAIDIDDSTPDENGCYPLTRQPTLPPSPPDTCSNCILLAKQLSEARTVNSLLLEGVEDTSRFLQDMDDSMDLHESEDEQQTISTCVLVAQNARLLRLNQDTVKQMESLRAENARLVGNMSIPAHQKGGLGAGQLEHLAAENEALKQRIKDVQDNFSRFFDLANEKWKEKSEVESKLETYKELNKGLALKNTSLKETAQQWMNQAVELSGELKAKEKEKKERITETVKKVEIAAWKQVLFLVIIIWIGLDVFRAVMML